MYFNEVNFAKIIKYFEIFDRNTNQKSKYQLSKWAEHFEMAKIAEIMQ